MSAVTSTEVITASLAGITVEKTFELEELPVPAVAYRIRSENPAAAAVRLVEGVPDGVDPDDIGFKSSLDGDHWHRGDGELVWRGTVEPDEEVVTCIGLRTDEPRDVFAFHGRPQIAAVEPTTDQFEETTAEADDADTTSGVADRHRPTREPRGTDTPSPGEWQRAVSEPEQSTEAVDDDATDAEATTRSSPWRARVGTLLRAGAKVALVGTLVGGVVLL